MLRIDLLPGHFAAARAAKVCLALVAVALLLAGGTCGALLIGAKSKKARLAEDLIKWTADADVVRALEAKVASVEAETAPIGGKVEFIEQADTCGEQYWAAWDDVNKYIYAQARVLDVSIASSRISFNAELPDTTSVGRFILNLLRCPDISNVQVGGTIPAGPGVGPNAGSASSGGGGMGMMGGGEMGMMGMPGGEMGGGEMGMMGGMPGMGGGGGGGGGSRSSGPISLTVSATLGTALATPVPGGGGGGAAGGPGGGMGGMGGGMGMPGGAGMGPGGGSGMGGPPGAGTPGSGFSGEGAG